MKSVAVLLFAAMLSGQSSISSPEIGFIEDHASALRGVSGVAGSFRLGNSIRTGVVSSAFSGSLGMAKTPGSIYVFDAAGSVISKTPAKAGAALFAFSEDGRSGLTYLVHEGSLIRWTDRNFTPVPLDFDAIGGEILSIAQPSASLASLLVERDGRIWLLNVSLTSGVVESRRALPGLSSPALLLNDGDLVFADQNGITIRRVNGTENRFEAKLSTNLRLRRMGAKWIQISDSAGHLFALSVQKGRERLYQLPEQRP